MKNKIGMGALCVLMACALMVSIGCKNDEGGDSWVSTLGAPKIGDISGLTGFTGETGVTAVADYNEARLFVNDFLSYAGSDLQGVASKGQTAVNKAFLAKFETTVGLWKLLQGKSYSYSVNIDDDETLKGGTITEGKIKGSTKESWSHNKLTYPEYYLSVKQEGDKISTSSSSSGTFSITGGHVIAEGNSDEYKVAGIIKIETSDKSSSTLTNKENSISTESSSSRKKVAAALLILNTDTRKAAKIRFSFASDETDKSRSAGGAETFNFSDIEVYDLAGNSITTIPASKVKPEDFLSDLLGN